VDFLFVFLREYGGVGGPGCRRACYVDIDIRLLAMLARWDHRRQASSMIYLRFVAENHTPSFEEIKEGMG